MEATTLGRLDVPGSPRIRLLAAQGGPARTRRDVREPGPLGIGFTTRGVHAVWDRVKSEGIDFLSPPVCLRPGSVGPTGPGAVKNYDALAPLGQVIYIGAIGGYPPPVDISKQLYAKTIAVRGFVVYVAMAATKGAEKPALHESLRSGRLQVPITGIVPLEETSRLHARFENRELMGKTLIKVGGDI